jgi:uncharacterized protein (TIGR03083 family)
MLEERRDIRRLLRELTDEQWNSPTLCGEWTVRELVAHLIAWDDLLLYRTRARHFAVLLRFSWLYAISLASMNRLNRRLQRHVRERDAAALADRFAADDVPDLKWLFDGSNPAAHLAEYVIHHQDIRRSLGMAREIPATGLVGALNGLTKLPAVRMGAARLLRRKKFEATDVEWSRGRGPIERLPGEEILMLLAGRSV